MRAQRAQTFASTVFALCQCEVRSLAFRSGRVMTVPLNDDHWVCPFRSPADFGREPAAGACDDTARPTMIGSIDGFGVETCSDDGPFEHFSLPARAWFLASAHHLDR